MAQGKDIPLSHRLFEKSYPPRGRSCYNGSMAKYAVFLEMRDRRAVVIGGGTVALRKAQGLLDAGARLIVVAEEPSDVLAALCTQYRAELVRSKYSKQYIAEAVLVIAATNDPKVNEHVYRDCQSLEILCNVVDDPQHCDFFVPAVVKRGDLQIAIGTEGYCPAYAGHLRQKLETIFTEEHGRFLAELERMRREIIDAVPASADRKSLLGELVDDESFEYFRASGPAAWRERAEAIIKSHTEKA
jgi:precorrin-2 dehydrogenase/sirohydrochlorin ferrochelatase